MPIRRRRLLLVAAVAAAGLTATGCAEQSAALRVGDDTVSQSDFEDELDGFASIYQGTVTGSLGGDSYSQEYAGTLLSQRIAFILIGQIFDDEGLELTDDDREQAVEQVAGALDDMPDDLRESLIDDIARQIKLQDELGADPYNEALSTAVDTADIEINTHYGTWDPEQLTVVPPPGPEPARGDG